MPTTKGFYCVSNDNEAALYVCIFLFFFYYRRIIDSLPRHHFILSSIYNRYRFRSFSKKGNVAFFACTPIQVPKQSFFCSPISLCLRRTRFHGIVSRSFQQEIKINMRFVMFNRGFTSIRIFKIQLGSEFVNHFHDLIGRVRCQ
jgi:hypothetical protein